MKILLIDDDADLGTMLARYFDGVGIEMHSLTCGLRALETVQATQYAAVLLDVTMPEVSGIEVLRQLRRHSQIPVLMLTGRSHLRDRVTGLETGADDYISKPFHPPELLARLKAVLRRTGPEEINFGDLTLAPQRRRMIWQGLSVQLTLAQCRLLEKLMRSAGTQVAKALLSESALGRDFKVGDRNVDMHVARVRRKLTSLTDGTIDIRSFRGLGYALVNGEPIRFAGSPSAALLRSRS